MHFDHCGSLRSLVPCLLFFMGIYVELGKKGLDITLVLGGQNDGLEVLSEGCIIVYVSFSWCLSASYAS